MSCGSESAADAAYPKRDKRVACLRCRVLIEVSNERLARRDLHGGMAIAVSSPSITSCNVCYCKSASDRLRADEINECDAS